MKKNVRYFLMKFEEKFLLISEDRINELVGGIVITIFEMAKILPLEDAVLNQLVSNISKGILNYQLTKDQPITDKTKTTFPVQQEILTEQLFYANFAGRGKNFFNMHFPNKECEDETKKKQLQAIIKEGWDNKKPTKQIAEEFGINYVTFNEKLTMWGIRSYAPQYEGRPYRKIFHRKHNS